MPVPVFLEALGSLSASHAREVGDLNTHIGELTEQLDEVRKEALQHASRAAALAGQAEASALDRSASEADALRAEEQGRAAEAIAKERRRYEEAASKLRALRQELMRMAQDADKRITEEAAARHAAEATAASLQARLQEVESKAAEIAAALRLTTLALRAAEARGYRIAAASEHSERELTDLRSIIDRTMSVVASGGTLAGGGASVDGVHATTSTAAGAGASSDPLNESLRSAAHLNDLTQRLSAYVESGSTRRRRRSSKGSRSSRASSVSSAGSRATIDDSSGASASESLLPMPMPPEKSHSTAMTAATRGPLAVPVTSPSHGLATAAAARPTPKGPITGSPGPAPLAGSRLAGPRSGHEVDLDAIGARLSALSRTINSTLGTPAPLPAQTPGRDEAGGAWVHRSHLSGPAPPAMSPSSAHLPATGRTTFDAAPRSGQRAARATQGMSIPGIARM